MTPHTMRHTAATNAAHAGLDAATIQMIGGWKTRAMAERYTYAASARCNGRTPRQAYQPKGYIEVAIANSQKRLKPLQGL
ncbi:tyrosine-type recombinase/integrase [Xanthomonas oryzae]|uniref:tyrosine-type recombinase/integrase n=1 Tax=Xanthomonas oryzae TaxID=347 RepID=UPI003CCFD5CC